MTEPQIDVRELTEADAGAYQVMRLRALKDHPEAYSSSFEEESKRMAEAVAERIRGTLESSDGFLLGAFVAGKLTGATGFYREQGVKTDHKGTIYGVYVSPESRRKGIARALMSEAIDRAESLCGIREIKLAVEAGNEPACSLYRSLGFEPFGLEREAIFTAGKYWDEQHLARRVGGVQS